MLRESNSTLRAESDGHARRARQLQTSLDQLQSELEPVKSEARTARAELEEKNRQIKRLEQENQQWKERNGQLLTKVRCDSTLVPLSSLYFLVRPH